MKFDEVVIQGKGEFRVLDISHRLQVLVEDPGLAARRVVLQMEQRALVLSPPERSPQALMVGDREAEEEVNPSGQQRPFHELLSGRLDQAMEGLYLLLELRLLMMVLALERAQFLFKQDRLCIGHRKVYEDPPLRHLLPCILRPRGWWLLLLLPFEEGVLAHGRKALPDAEHYHLNVQAVRKLLSA